MNKRMMGIFSPKIAIGLAAFASLGIGTVAVYKMLERTGESAIRMIPADAALIISLDTSPSPSQVRLYNEISLAMKDSGMNDFIDNILAQADGGQGALKTLRSHVKGSFAAGAWGDITKGNPNWVTAIAIDNSGKAETLVAGASGIRATNHKGRMFYSAKGAPAVITFFGDYCLVSNKPESAERAIAVANDQEASVYDEGGFQQARESLPQDAGLMVFLNGKALAEMDEEARKAFKSLGVDNEGWFAMGATLRDEGILIDCSSPLGSGGIPAALNKMENLSFASFESYPTGALGVAGLSSPTALYDMMREIIKSDSATESEFDKGIAEVEKQTGLSFQNEILPGFKGEASFAVYPPETEGSDMRFVMSLDNQHGGKATELATRLMELVETKKVEGPTFTKATEGSWTIYSADREKVHIAIGGDKVIVSSSTGLARQVAGGDAQSLLYSDAFSNMSENKNAKFVLQIDTDRLATLIEKNIGDGGPPIREFLTGKPLTMTWTTTNNASKTQMLIPVDIPAMIRFGGKTVNGGGAAQPMSPGAMGHPGQFPNPAPQIGESKIVIKKGG